MQTVKIILATKGEDGRTVLDAGEVHAVSPAFARWLVDRKRARIVAAAPRVVPVVEDPWCATEDESPAGPEVTSEPAEESPKRRPRKGRR